MPVAVMRQVLSQREYTDWLRYFFNEDPDVNEIQMAVLSTMVHQGLGGKNAKVDDYLIRKPKKEPEKIRPMTGEEVLAAFAGVTSPMEDTTPTES